VRAFLKADSEPLLVSLASTVGVEATEVGVEVDGAAVVAVAPAATDTDGTLELLAGSAAAVPGVMASAVTARRMSARLGCCNGSKSSPAPLGSTTAR
jgi:hypothetical protein